MKKILLLVLSIFVIGQALQAFDYIWPVDVSRKLSATFGEFRTGHFHSGIDIKTDHTIHHPVYSISDGYVWRIVESYAGYGKALYVKMKDGNFAVYAHLDDFPPKIEKHTEQEQERLGRYRINKYFKAGKIPVKKGELIAYTGRTGTVHPHLHFEIRTPDHKPINALLTNLKKDDVTPPIIKSIALTPLTKTSRINYSPEIQTYKSYKSGGNYYLSESPIPVKDSFGVEIKTYDIVKGLYNKYGPYKIKMFIDDSLAFHIQCDTLSFKKTGLINFDRNSLLMQNGKGRYIRLWRFLENTKLPFYRGKYTGYLNPGPGEHDIRIVVEDFNTNTSEINFSIETTRYNLPKIKRYDIAGDSLSITLARDSLDYLYSRINATWHNRSQQSNARLINFKKDKANYKFQIPITNANPALCLITQPIISSIEQKIFLPCNNGTNLNEDDIDIRYIQNPESFLVNFNFAAIPDSIPELYVQTSNQFQQVQLISKAPDEFITAPVDYSLWDSAFAMEIRIGSKIILRRKINLHQISSKKEYSIHSKDSVLSIYFDKNSVHRDVLISLTKKDVDLSKQNNVVSPVYKITPTSLNLLKPGKINFQYDTTLTDLSKIGIYTYYKNKYYYLNSDINPESKAFTTSAKAGQFCLVKDTKPPEIRIIKPRSGATYSRSSLGYISAKVDDELSGIRDDMSISLNIDGADVICEYNAPTDKIRYKPKNIQPGKHNYTISVTDKMGNTSIRKGIFYIK